MGPSIRVAGLALVALFASWTTAALGAIPTALTIGAISAPGSNTVRLSAGVESCAPASSSLQTGLIEFYDSSTLVGTANFLPSGPPPAAPVACSGGVIVANATFGPYLTAVAPGTHVYKAVYVGDAVYAGSTSADVVVVIPGNAVPAVSAPFLAMLTLGLAALGAAARRRPTS